MVWERVWRTISLTGLTTTKASSCLKSWRSLWRRLWCGGGVVVACRRAGDVLDLCLFSCILLWPFWGLLCCLCLLVSGAWVSFSDVLCLLGSCFGCCPVRLGLLFVSPFSGFSRFNKIAVSKKKSNTRSC